jgi:hypothetical protein
VVRNVRKAREAGIRALIALPDASGVPRVLQVLDSAFLGLRLWLDGVGVVSRGQGGSFHPHRLEGTLDWSFLEDGSDGRTLDGPEQNPEIAPSPLVETDPLPRLLRRIVEVFVRAGKTEATSDEFFSALPATEQARRTDEQVGVALSKLGVSHHRARINGSRLRVYELSTARTSVLKSSEMDLRGPRRWSINSPSENN